MFASNKDPLIEAGDYPKFPPAPSVMQLFNTTGLNYSSAMLVLSLDVPVYARIFKFLCLNPDGYAIEELYIFGERPNRKSMLFGGSC